MMTLLSLILLIVNVAVHLAAFLPDVPAALFSIGVLFPLLFANVVAIFAMCAMGFFDIRRLSAAWQRKSHAEKIAQRDAILRGEPWQGVPASTVPRKMRVIFALLFAYTFVSFAVGLYFIDDTAVAEDGGSAFARHFWPLSITTSFFVFTFFRYRRAPAPAPRP